MDIFNETLISRALKSQKFVLSKFCSNYYLILMLTSFAKLNTIACVFFNLNINTLENIHFYGM